MKFRGEILKNAKTYEKHLQDYNKIDLSLDTFPYTGVTTSFESIIMGVPVLTLKGFNFNSRCGESINKNLDLIDFIAKDFDDYSGKAISFSDNKTYLSNLRKSLRQKSIESPLFDIEDFTTQFMNILKNLN